MHIDINLLPEKEKKNIANLFIIILFSAILVIVVIAAFVHFNQAQSKLSYIENQVKNVQQLRQIESEKLADLTKNSKIKELNQAVAWVNKIPISTVFVLNHVSALLPARGFVLDFQYTDKGIVELTVQFDTNREAAYYLNALNHSEYIYDVDLQSIKSESLEKKNLHQTIPSETFLPRYVANYMITLNKKALREQTAEGDEK